jgi:hypothetical protein
MPAEASYRRIARSPDESAGFVCEKGEAGQVAGLAGARWRGILLPNGLPQIFIGVRIAASVSLIGSVVTDLFAGQDGLGYLLFERAFALRVPDVLAPTVLRGLSGMLFNQMVPTPARNAFHRLRSPMASACRRWPPKARTMPLCTTCIPHSSSAT